MGDDVAGIGALLRPNKYAILKFVNIHPGGAAAASGEIQEDDRLVAVNGVVVKGMSAEEVVPVHPTCACANLHDRVGSRNFLQVCMYLTSCEPVAGCTQVAPLIRGPVGSKVELEILRPGGSKTQLVTLTRVKIEQSGPAPPPVKPRPEYHSVTGLGIRASLAQGAAKLANQLQKTGIGSPSAAHGGRR